MKGKIISPTIEESAQNGIGQLFEMIKWNDLRILPVIIAGSSLSDVIWNDVHNFTGMVLPQ